MGVLVGNPRRIGSPELVVTDCGRCYSAAMEKRLIAALSGLLWLSSVAAPAQVAVPEPVEPPTAPYDFALGKLLLAEGNYAKALEALERAVRAEPDEAYVHLVLAETNLRIGRMQPAVAHADRSVALAPRDPDVLDGAARVLVAFGERDAEVGQRGEEHFEALLELQPEDLETLHILGSLHQRRGDLAGAELYFQRIATLQPGPRTASVLLQLYLDQGKSDEAIELLTEVLVVAPEELEMRLTLADLLAEAGNHAEAARVLMEAPGGAAENEELARRVAVELYRSGEPDAALSALEEVLSRDSSPRLRLFHALLLSEIGRSEDALASLQGLHAELPEDPEVALSLSRMFSEAGRFDDASRALDQTLTALGDGEGADRVRMELAQILAADDSWELALAQADALQQASDEGMRRVASLIRVDALLGLDRPEEAESAFQALLDGGIVAGPELVAKHAEILFRLGRDAEARAKLEGLEPPDHVVELYQRLGRFEDSIPLLVQMVDENPQSLQARFWLGAAYERTGRVVEAESQFKELVRRYPDFHLGLNYLGYMYAQQGENLDEALELVQRAVGLSPSNGAYIDSLGWVYYKLGDYDVALAHLKRASVLEPDDGTVFDHLGDAYLALGDHDRAVEAYRKALALDGLDDRGQVEDKLDQVEKAVSRVDR